MIIIQVAFQDSPEMPFSKNDHVHRRRGLGYRARERRGYGPLTVGLAASVAVLTYKFVIEFSAGTYVGIGLLVLASLWNTWPRYAATCLPSCVGSRKISQHIQVKENRNGESKA